MKKKHSTVYSTVEHALETFENEIENARMKNARMKLSRGYKTSKGANTGQADFGMKRWG